MEIHNSYGISTIDNLHKPYGPYEKFFKRPLDFTLAFITFIILSPVLLILTAAGAIAMNGNPFFVQERPGRINRKTRLEKIFLLIKFRTMSNAKDASGNLLPDEKRLNQYGKFLRSTSLDELPELINIVKGDMAVVGGICPDIVLSRGIVMMYVLVLQEMLRCMDETVSRGKKSSGLTMSIRKM